MLGRRLARARDARLPDARVPDEPPAAARARADAGARVSPRAAVHAATVGLVGVLAALTVFSVTTAVTDARAAERAQLSAVVSAWSREALTALVLEENLVDQLKAPGPEEDGETAQEYLDARAAVDEALDGLRGSVTPSRRGTVEDWATLHARYGRAVEAMLTGGPMDPSAAEDHEETYVDPYFDPLEAALENEVQRHFEEASTALTAIGSAQQAKLVATPVVFGLGLALVLFFSAVVVRGRRAVVEQGEENRRQALRDPLTGLPNRRAMGERVDALLSGSAPDAAPITLLLIDLDRFKEINDTLGHRYGDRVLEVLAGRLGGCVPASATVARLGGDEFAILLPDVDDVASALAVAATVQATMDTNVDAHGIFLDVDASIGIALGEGDMDAQALLRHADIAMYRAKSRGTGVCVYDEDIDEHSREQLALLAELRGALDAGDLVLHFQPKLALADGRLCGVEALVRWQHPVLGLLPPARFVPVAERTALIHPLTRYVLSAALAECRRWHDAGRELHVAVNVSVRNLLDDAFLADVTGLLAAWGVPAQCLELEVTESAIMADPGRARLMLAAFADLGVTLSIDDFGAGYTSLAHLTRLPVHTVKIDRSLVARMVAEPTDAVVVRSVIELAHHLGLTTVAEGVEDAATRDRLAALGCDVAQGYLFSRPVPAADLAGWVTGPDHARAERQRTVTAVRPSLRPCPESPAPTGLLAARSS